MAHGVGASGKPACLMLFQAALQGPRFLIPGPSSAPPVPLMAMSFSGIQIPHFCLSASYRSSFTLPQSSWLSAPFPSFALCSPLPRPSLSLRPPDTLYLASPHSSPLWTLPPNNPLNTALTTPLYCSDTSHGSPLPTLRTTGTADVQSLQKPATRASLRLPCPLTLCASLPSITPLPLLRLPAGCAVRLLPAEIPFDLRGPLPNVSSPMKHFLSAI